MELITPAKIGDELDINTNSKDIFGCNITGDRVFKENIGQFDKEEGQYYLHDDNLMVYFKSSSLHFRIDTRDDGDQTISTEFQMIFQSSIDVPPEGRKSLDYQTNFFLGQDPSAWITKVNSFREILYRNVYNSIDLTFRYDNGILKYLFTLHPNADADDIRITYSGVNGIEIDPATGNLNIETDIGRIVDAAPTSFQSDGGLKIDIPSEFQIVDKDTVSIDVDDYNAGRTLVIDPGLTFSTYVGGSDYETGNDIVLDGSGSIYVTGVTRSTDLPTTTGAYNRSLSGSTDAFIMKMNGNGTAIIFSTYIGGSSDDFSEGIDIDQYGNVYITGRTQSNDFPVTVGAYDRSFNDDQDAFLTKLNSTGNSLDYSTYIGGAQDKDGAYDLWVGDESHVYVTGFTSSRFFPTTSGTFDRTHNGK